MSNLVVDAMDAAWTASGAGLQVSADTSEAAVPGGTSVRLAAPAGAAGAFAERTFPLASRPDLSEFDELRLWISASRPADGSLERPFWLELSYKDAGDQAGEEHRWLVPVNRAGEWEQRRIGIEAERRSAITSIRFTALDGDPFDCRVDELLAVREELIADVERALVARLDGVPQLPGVADVKLKTTAQLGQTSVELPLAEGFHDGNRVLLHGGTGADETHDVVNASHDTAGATTTLSFAAGDPVGGQFNANTAGVTLLVPVSVEAPPAAPAQLAPTPAITLTYLEAREEPARGPDYLQRDSFRNRGAGVVCSVRPAAQAWRIDYEVTSSAPLRDQQVPVQEYVLRSLAGRARLRVTGYPSPVWELDPPGVMTRGGGLAAPLYVRVSTRREVAPRSEQRWVLQAGVVAAQLDAPQDSEQVQVTL